MKARLVLYAAGLVLIAAAPPLHGDPKVDVPGYLYARLVVPISDARSRGSVSSEHALGLRRLPGGQERLPLDRAAGVGARHDRRLGDVLPAARAGDADRRRPRLSLPAADVQSRRSAALSLSGAIHRLPG